MAKYQRSLMLNRELAERVAAIESATGATFTRVIAASLIGLVAGGAEQHPSYKAWMRAIRKLDKGTATLDEALQMIREGIE